MTEKKQRAAALAAASVLGLSLGMVALTADADQAGNNQTSNQIKGQTANQIKAQSNQIKLTPPSSNQGKFWKPGTSNQHKVTTPSPDLNPQPEPPKPSGDSKPH